MQESSCYCESLSHSRSGRTISTRPGRYVATWHADTHCTGSGSPCLKAAGKIRSDRVYVCRTRLVHMGWEGCVRGICPFQFTFFRAHGRLCKETGLLLWLAAATEPIVGCPFILGPQTDHVPWLTLQKNRFNQGFWFLTWTARPDGSRTNVKHDVTDCKINTIYTSS